jgi:hypothetical protein
MDSNFEAQEQFTRQRLSARREQAQAERFLREVRPVRMGSLRRLLVQLFAQTRLFGRPARREEKNHAQQSSSARLAITGKD